jgi:predicted nucleotidyltransferase
MAIDPKTAIEIAKNYAKDVQKALPIDKAFLYGSYAKGTADSKSDMDVCFFLNYGKRNKTQILKRLFKLARPYSNAFLEPNVFETSDLNTGNPFVEEVVRTGWEIL